MATDKTIVKILHDLDGIELIHAHFEQFRFPTHFHNTFVVELVLAGEDWCSDAQQIASQGEVYVHFPFAPHTGGTHGSKPLIYRAIYPSVSLVCELTGIGPSQIPLGCTLVLNDSKLVQMTNRLFRQFDEGSGSPSRRDVKHLFEFILMHSLAIRPASVGLCRGADQKMQLAREFLLKNYVRDVSIDELAEQCELSPFHLIRSFRKRFGITPRQFLISHRVAVAKELISCGTSITKAAHETGFSDHSHLTRSFKRITNYTPSQVKSQRG